MLARELLGGPRGTRPRPERGAVAVEFALILPVLVMMLMGIVTAGLSYSRAMGLTNAVREGARFGATADATAAGTWADGVIARVRATQFDDPSSPQSIVCVQLWQIGGSQIPAPPVTPSSGKCDPAAGLGISVPSSASDAPAVPSAPAGACVVRVIAARNYTINIGLFSWTRVNVASSIARYERSDKVAACS